MILFSSRKLERALATNQIDSWGKTKYIIAGAVFQSAMGSTYVFRPSFGPKPSTLISVISEVSTVLGIFIVYFGIKKCYLTNKNGDDQGFIERYIALGVPMSIKFSVVLVPVFIFGAIFSFALAPDKELMKNIFSYTLYALASISVYVYYVFLNRSFARLVGQIEVGFNDATDLSDHMALNE